MWFLTQHEVRAHCLVFKLTETYHTPSLTSGWCYDRRIILVSECIQMIKPVKQVNSVSDLELTLNSDLYLPLICAIDLRHPVES